MKKYGKYFINFLNLDNNLIYFGIYQYNGLGYNPNLIYDFTMNNGGWLLYDYINVEKNNLLTLNEIFEIQRICEDWYMEILKIAD